MYRVLFILCSWCCILGSQNALGQLSITLKESILQSKANNPYLRNQKLDVNIAQADITSAQLRLNPDFQAQVYLNTNNRNWAPNTGLLSTQNTQTWYQVGMPIRLQPIRKLATAVATNNVDFTQRNITEIERNLAFDVANTWLSIWALKMNIEILRTAKVNIDSLVKINENRLENQVITISELIRTEVLSEQYALQLRDNEQENTNLTRLLKLAMGSQDSISIDTNDETVFVNPFDQIDSLQAKAKQKRTDLQTAQMGVKTAKSNVELQKALAYPNLYGAAFFNPQNNVPYVGFIAGIQVPIFDRNQGEIERSTAIVKQSEGNVSAIELSIKTEVNNAYQAYLLRKGNLQRFQNIMIQSEKVLNTVKYRYLKGNTTIIDFLEAQRTSLETKKTYYDEVLAYRRSYLLLLYVSGLINEI